MGETLKTAVVDGFQTAVTDTVGLITALLPIGLTLFVATWGIIKAKQFFTKTAN